MSAGPLKALEAVFHSVVVDAQNPVSRDGKLSQPHPKQPQSRPMEGGRTGLLVNKEMALQTRETQEWGRKCSCWDRACPPSLMRGDNEHEGMKFI